MSDASAGSETDPVELLAAILLLPQPATASAAATASAVVVPLRIGAQATSSERVEAPQERARRHHLGAVPAHTLREVAVGGHHRERARIRVGGHAPRDHVVGGIAAASWRE